MSVPHLVYLHGFLSGPGSSKARETALFMDRLGLADHFHCPELPRFPPLSKRACAKSSQASPASRSVWSAARLAVHATWAAETFGCRAVLLNPAVRPYEFVKDYTGPQRNYVTGEVQIVDASLADDLRAMERQPSRPSDYWLLVQTGDETLNYREAVRFYTGCRQTVIEGGEHGFSGYAEKLPQIWDFAQRGDQCPRPSLRAASCPMPIKMRCFCCSGEG